MSGLESLNKRLLYYGHNQQGRMIKDKQRTLKKTLLYSYQSQTAVLSNGREFRCLINPDKNKPAYDNKILSIPYKDICLNQCRIGKTSQGQIKTNIAPGQVFKWKETNTYWLVYLQYIQESAYFRSQIRRCDQCIKVNNIPYWVYIRGPTETSIEWTQKSKIEWNTLNYSLVMYITSDENTNNYFQRFQKIKVIDPRYNIEKTWQIVGVDPYYGDGILQIFLDEYFENSIADAVSAQQQTKKLINESLPYIDGPTKVSQYSKAYYSVKNITGGEWLINWKDEERSLNYTKDILPLEIPVGELDSFILIYRTNEQEDVTLQVTIIPL